jgi:flavin reductase (DIM6/NTAB) family NADH-FMN oxidoreductase RutF
LPPRDGKPVKRDAHAWRALASFDCHITQVVSVGTHDILFCEIQAIAHHPAPEGLVV